MYVFIVTTLYTIYIYSIVYVRNHMNKTFPEVIHVENIVSAFFHP